MYNTFAVDFFVVPTARFQVVPRIYSSCLKSLTILKPFIIVQSFMETMILLIFEKKGDRSIFWSIGLFLIC